MIYLISESRSLEANDFPFNQQNELVHTRKLANESKQKTNEKHLRELAVKWCKSEAEFLEKRKFIVGYYPI